MLQRALLAAAALVFAIMLARFFEGGDYSDPARGSRHCGAPPQEIKSWSYTSRTLRPEDQAGLEQWLQKEPDQVNQLFGAFCHSALHTAARFGREDLAALLITRGANVNVGTEPRGETPLHLAAQYGQASVAAVLVSRGADVNAATTFGRTPLISRGANVNARERGSGRTPLDQTTGTVNQERLATLLVEAGANPGR
jgi:hypothetical protein